MAIITIKELEARRAASQSANAAQRPDAAASLSAPGTEADRSAARVLPRDLELPRAIPVARSASESDDADELQSAESVGYCRPPVASRFRAGDGRPRGPAKGSRRLKSLEAIQEKWLGQLTSVRIGGRSVRVTRVERMLLLSFDKAEKGDYRAIRDALDRYERAFPEKAGAKVVKTDPTATDTATLAAYRAQIMADLNQQ